MMENFVFSFIPISLILNFVQIIETQTITPFPSCAINLQSKAARGRIECMTLKNNAPDCVIGYNTVISNIPILCGGFGSGLKQRDT